MMAPFYVLRGRSPHHAPPGYALLRPCYTSPAGANRRKRSIAAQSCDLLYFDGQTRMAFSNHSAVIWKFLLFRRLTNKRQYMTKRRKLKTQWTIGEPRRMNIVRLQT
uniref:Uncharacterized protein n=1 Tax=Romanomermis culicivorax TaxID=13658 RepID=A0A915JZ28_ROMCU